MKQEGSIVRLGISALQGGEEVNYICSHAGKIGNIRWVNSDTRWPDAYKPLPGGGFQLGYWGRWGLVEPSNDDADLTGVPLP